MNEMKESDDRDERKSSMNMKKTVELLTIDALMLTLGAVLASRQRAFDLGQADPERTGMPRECGRHP